MEKTTIIILLIVLAVIILGKEKFIITTNEDKLATNIYFDASTNLLKFGSTKEDINYEATAIDKSGNKLYIVGEKLNNNQLLASKFFSSPSIKIYKNPEKTELIGSYNFGNNNTLSEEFVFNSDNPWILWPTISAAICAFFCLVFTSLYFFK
jgi:hypothetical protein